MRLYIAFALLLSSCLAKETKHKELRLGDVIKFEFKQRNMFYAKACSDKGVVLDMPIGAAVGDDAAGAKAYLVKIKCTVGEQEDSRFIWIDAEDIVDVVKLAN